MYVYNNKVCRRFYELYSLTASKFSRRSVKEPLLISFLKAYTVESVSQGGSLTYDSPRFVIRSRLLSANCEQPD